MVIKGKLITCKRQVKQFEKAETKNKLWITLAEVNLSKEKKAELEEAYKDSGKKFTPDWLKDFKGYVNLSTDFELPCKDPDGNEYHSIERFITEDKFPFMGAECKVSININTKSFTITRNTKFKLFCYYLHKISNIFNSN